MADFDPRNTYRIFINENATGKQPYIKGFFTDMDGKEWEMPAWEYTSKQGKTYYSGRLAEPYVKEESQSGYDKFKQQGQSLQSKKDVVLDDINEDEDLLSQIPF